MSSHEFYFYFLGKVTSSQKYLISAVHRVSLFPITAIRASPSGQCRTIRMRTHGAHLETFRARVFVRRRIKIPTKEARG